VSLESAPAKYRLFFALWPPGALQAWLAAVAQKLQGELGGKMTRADSIHLTLVFLGDVLSTRLDEVVAIGDAVRWHRFTLTIDTCGCWAHNRIAWAGPEGTPLALTELVTELQTGVRVLGFAIDERPYAPHITLVRKARRPLRKSRMEVAEQWPVEEFVLIRSQLDAQGSRYSAIRRWSCEP
jgi:RNA 2',3'-cyclic 3'-phosphodiesterase